MQFIKVLFKVLFVLRRKNKILVGVTTFYKQYLKVSVSGLAQLNKDFVLVIHNDNPNTKVTKREIRKIGYRGELHIINTAYNKGLLKSRLTIIDWVKSKRKNPDWIVFVDDDDMLLNLDIPSVSENNFAIIQNMAVVRTRMVDVLRLMDNSRDYEIDNENVYLVRPHIGMAGTLVRGDVIMGFAEKVNSILSDISDIDESLSYRPPVDMMMWSGLNIFARHLNDAATPIYMDTVNYIATDIDTAPEKYGMKIQPAKNPATQISHAIARYDAALRAVLDAAPAGQE